MRIYFSIFIFFIFLVTIFIFDYSLGADCWWGYYLPDGTYYCPPYPNHIVQPPPSPTPPPPNPKTQYVCNLSSHTCYKCSGDYCPSPSFSTMSQCEQSCGNWVQVKKCVPGFLGIGRICNPSPCRDVPPGTCKDTCQTNADCSGSPPVNPVNQGPTPPTTSCKPCRCSCSYNCCKGNCCIVNGCPATYDCCCGTSSCPSDKCSPFPPYINSFSIYPNRLFTNQAFNISYQATRTNVCSNTISCSVEGKYLGHNCGQKNVLNICPSSESQRLRVWDPNNQLLKLSKSSSRTVSASISLTPTIDFWGKYQYTLTCSDGCYQTSNNQEVFVLPVLYYQETPFSSILQPFLSLIKKGN